MQEDIKGILDKLDTQVGTGGFSTDHILYIVRYLFLLFPLSLECQSYLILKQTPRHQYNHG